MSLLAHDNGSIHILRVRIVRIIHSHPDLIRVIVSFYESRVELLYRTTLAKLMTRMMIISPRAMNTSRRMRQQALKLLLIK